MSALASDTAMVMAAGLGKRMRPLTATQPKPMVRVAGKPLIDHALDRLDEAGVAKAVVNVHYLADALEADRLPQRVAAQELLQLGVADLGEDGHGGGNVIPICADSAPGIP